MALLTAQLPTSSVNGAVFIGSGNALEITLLLDGAAFDATTITRAVITLGSYSIDSDSYPSAFDFTQGSGKVLVTLGSFPLAEGLQSLRLTVYDPTASVSGRVWLDGVPVFVAAENQATVLAAYGSVVLVSPDGTQYIYALDGSGVPYTVALPNAAATAVSEIIMQSPDGTAWKFAVTNAGVPYTEAA